MKRKLTLSINYLNLISLLYLVAVTIYAYFPIQRIGFFLFFGSYLIEIFLEKKWNNIRLDKKGIYFLGMFLFFLLAILYLPFEDSIKYTNVLIEKRLPLLGLSIVGFLGLNKKFKLNYFLNTFIISSIAAIFYLIFIRIGIHEFISNPLRSDVFMTNRIAYVNGHLMFNFYLNMSLISIWFVLSNRFKEMSWWKITLYITAFILFFYILSISEGRTGFTEGCLLLSGFIFIEIWKQKRKVALIIIALIPLLLFGVFSQHKRMSEKEIQTEPRLFLWQSAIPIIKEKPILGNGISVAQEKFDISRTKYQTEEFRLWSQQLKCEILDSHNQYLQTIMEFGIIGLLLLVFLYFFPILIAEKRKKLFAILLMFLCAYHSVFDMFLTGQFSFLFGLIVILILLVENNVVRIYKNS